MPNGTNPQRKDILQLLRGFIGKEAQRQLEQNPLYQLKVGAQKLGTALGVMSTFVPGEQGEMGRVKKELQAQLNPMQENVIKAVQKIQTKKVEEAMEMGASGEQVLADAGVSFADTQPKPQVDETTGVAQADPISMALTGQQPPELAQQEIPFRSKREEFFSPIDEFGRPKPSGLLGSLFGIMPPGALERATTLQKLTGQVPLQRGEREKLELTADLDAINKQAGAGLQKPLSAAASETVANTTMGMKLIDSLSTAFKTDPSLFRAIWTAGNPRAQIVRTSVTNLWDTIARMRTGAAINPSEEKLYKSLVPLVGMKARFETEETVKFKLEMIRELFSDVKRGIQPEQRMRKASFVQQALNDGWSPSEIRNYLKGRK